jgi:FKBP-type peptidyl-prolyl cis-trans isomerase 2
MPRNHFARLCLALAGILLLPVPQALAEDANALAKEEATVIAAGRTVSMEYTLTLDDGTTLDTNVGGEPLVFEHGSQQIIPGLEKQLEGLSAGESRTVVVVPEEAYGPVDPEAFQEVELEQIPGDARAVGTILVADDGSGNQRQVRVAEVRHESVLIDFNHPLAGKTLNFAVKILEVR